MMKPPRGAQLNRSHPLAKGLVGCWLLNEGMGTQVVDVSGRGLDGSLQYADAASAWHASPYGPAVWYDGLNDRIYAGEAASDLSIAESMSVLCLCSLASTDQHRPLISRHSPSYGWLLNFYYPSSQFEWRISTTGSDWNGGFGSSVVSGGQWYMVVGTYDGAYMRLYVNGNEEGNDFPFALSGVPNQPNVPIGIGRDDRNDRVWHGYIAIAAVWNRALSAAEVRWLYEDPYCMFRPSRPRWFFIPAGGLVSIYRTMQRQKRIAARGVG